LASRLAPLRRNIWTCGSPNAMRTPVAHALLRAAPRLVSASGGRRQECRCSTQERSHSAPHNNSNENDSRHVGRTPPSARVPPDPPFRGLTNFASRPTLASAADQGVRPTSRSGCFRGCGRHGASSTGLMTCFFRLPTCPMVLVVDIVQDFLKVLPGFFLRVLIVGP
jgi:hypothetical protein